MLRFEKKPVHGTDKNIKGHSCLGVRPGVRPGVHSAIMQDGWCFVKMSCLSQVIRYIVSFEMDM